MAIIIVIDTCVLRRALEYEKSIKIDDKSKKAYEIIIEFLQRKDTIFVANSETKCEYYRHLENLKNEIRRKRIYPQSFGLLRSLMFRLRTVPDRNHSFEFTGNQLVGKITTYSTLQNLVH